MTYTPSQLLTFETFVRQYGDRSRYELADGELIDMEPTGPHEAVAGKLASKLSLEIDRQNLPFLIPKSCILRPDLNAATARRPDVIVLDERALIDEPYWSREPVILRGQSIKLVVEVVSTNWENDYARKVEEYALMGIPEYWIVDFRGLGGIRFIGDPKQPTFTVNDLQGKLYEQQQYRSGDRIHSLLFPDLDLKLDDVMPRLI
ncbi:MAG TPA: Uma2 family endonuclease [Oscillatoriales cyanobacterium M59_W2019_021]|nr:MAG: Uma2 family endonuclease [Cyanobacteria bacterium J055]HIK33796.1 Uma2 family endonuclease [Oscillatoriales cyanobacterium M4454_W2019_049]HIK51617.1 Uma2 family endonuclease [Oscillatoriales cyanobacterium M59_W2019_021]